MNLDERPTHAWTNEEARSHLTATFNSACASHPDLMEPYLIALSAAEPDEEVSIMRRGLRETIKQRFPLPGAI
jgi:hypothetical protein